jgi:hypothetical protein
MDADIASRIKKEGKMESRRREMKCGRRGDEMIIEQ